MNFQAKTIFIKTTKTRFKTSNVTKNFPVEIFEKIGNIHFVIRDIVKKYSDILRSALPVLFSHENLRIISCRLPGKSGSLASYRLIVKNSVQRSASA